MSHSEMGHNICPIFWLFPFGQRPAFVLKMWLFHLTLNAFGLNRWFIGKLFANLSQKLQKSTSFYWNLWDKHWTIKLFLLVHLWECRSQIWFELREYWWQSIVWWRERRKSTIIKLYAIPWKKNKTVSHNMGNINNLILYVFSLNHSRCCWKHHEKSLLAIFIGSWHKENQAEIFLLPQLTQHCVYRDTAANLEWTLCMIPRSLIHIPESDYGLYPRDSVVRIFGLLDAWRKHNVI